VVRHAVLTLMDIEVTGARELVASLRGAPARVTHQVARAMRDEMVRLAGDVQSRQLSGQALKVRTGTLRRSVFSRVEIEPSAIVGRVGIDASRAVYGRVHELGGDITPKRGKYLTIPLDAAVTGQQRVARFSARELMANPQAFGYKSAFVRRSQGGRAEAVILGVKGTSKAPRLVPLFALTRRVTVHATHYMANAFSAATGRIMLALERAVAQALGDGGGPA
jgi:hypothetical protein